MSPPNQIHFQMSCHQCRACLTLSAQVRILVWYQGQNNSAGSSKMDTKRPRSEGFSLKNPSSEDCLEHLDLLSRDDKLRTIMCLTKRIHSKTIRVLFVIQLMDILLKNGKWTDHILYVYSYWPLYT